MECGDIAEAEFATRLHTLGVETHGLSFGWMLNEYDAHGVLRWMFMHLSSDNALTAREACRYSELEEKGLLLPEGELQAAVAELQREHPGLVLAGDAEGLRRARRQNRFLRERLALLRTQEATLDTLKKQNEVAREEVTGQVAELRAGGGGGGGAGGGAAGERCLRAAESVERREAELFAAVARNISLYCDHRPGKESRKRFVSAGPLDAYTQSRRLFRSHFRLCASRQFDAERWRDAAGARTDRHHAAAKLAERRLYDAIVTYVESAVSLNVIHAEVQVVAGYEEVHPGRVLVATTECLSSIELLRQDAELAQEKLTAAARDLVRRQTARADTARARAALQQRRELHSIMCTLHARALSCASLDALLYLALRREWQRAEDTVRFACDVRDYLQAERANVAARIDAMTSLYREHTECAERQRTHNLLLTSLQRLHGSREEETSDSLERREGAARTRLAQLREEIEGEFRRKEQFLDELTTVSRPLAAAVHDGSTRRANARDLALGGLLLRLRTDTARLDEKVSRAVDAFTRLKSKDKDMSRKLWQWFLTDPERLLSKMEELRRQAAR